MPGTEFDDPVLLRDGTLQVSGPYDPGIHAERGDEIVGDVIIRFLFFTEENDKILVNAEGVGTWSYEPPDRDGHYPPWRGVAQSHGLSVGDRVRAVGVAVQATKYDPDPKVPPSITSLNWCVTRHVAAPAQSASSGSEARVEAPVGVEAEPQA